MDTLSTDTRFNEELENRLASQKANLQDLATMGAVITSIHEIQAVLSVVMEMAIRLVNGEVGTILLDDNDHLVGRAAWGINSDFIKTIKFKDGIDLATHCYTHRETVILSNLGSTTSEGLKIESVLCAPIQTSKTCYGSIVIINKSDQSVYTEEDKEILELLLNFVAVAIENSILMKERLERQKIEQEMLIAKQIQETILPQDIDSISGVDIGAVYFPAQDVGGDFYDVVKISDTQIVVLMGDVSNKGVPAALVMSAASAIIKSTLTHNPEISISELASVTNNMLSYEIIKDKEMFVTLFFSKLDLENNLLTFCNAGHVPGLFWDSKAGKVIELSEGGPIIGQFPEIKFEEGEQKLSSGDRLFLFTDGLTESADKSGELFGRERAEKVLIQEIELSPKEFCLKVKEWVDTFTVDCSEDMIDDFTIMQVKAE